jgi:hypothetical protein
VDVDVVVGEAHGSGAGAVVGPDHALVPRRRRHRSDCGQAVTLALHGGDQLVEFVVGEIGRVDVEERIDRLGQLVDPLRHDDKIAQTYDKSNQNEQVFATARRRADVQPCSSESGTTVTS